MVNTALVIIAFVVLYAFAVKMDRDPIAWCILGLFISPLGAFIAMVLYTWIIGD